MAEIPFPGGAADQDVFFHEDKVCVYHAATNTWECRAMAGETPQPDLPAIYTTDVYVPEGLRESIRTTRVGVPSQIEDVQAIQTQYDANQALLKEGILSSKNLARNSDLINFTQNTTVQGYWVHTMDEGGPPDEAEFYAYDENGFNTTQFEDMRLIKFNDNGVAANPGSENALQSAKVGDYLVMQEINDNHFGMYVIETLTTYNTEGVIYRELGVKLYRNARAYGDCQYLSHCSVRVTRPSSVVVQDDQPLVSSRGILWYRESDDVLSISNYADGFTGQGPQWTEINGSGNYVTSQYLEQRLAAIQTNQLPSNLITDSELEVRLAQIDIPTIPSNLATTTYVESRISSIPPHTGPTQQDFTALTQTLTAALNQVAANVESKATQQDVSLAVTAVDAKFDMLRSAIAEATDFDTLKARLLAVLQ